MVFQNDKRDVSFLPKSSRATLAQVAQLAGVSQAAASLILRGDSKVSFAESTVARVCAAAKYLGYITEESTATPGGIFEKKVLAIITPSIASYSYYSTIIQAIDQAANSKGFDTLCFQSYYEEAREMRCISYLLHSDIAGVIFTFTPHNLEWIVQISNQLPVVIFGNNDLDVPLDIVKTDNYGAGVMLAEHIIDLGHRRVAYLHSKSDWWGYPSSIRKEGVIDTFRRKCPSAELFVTEREWKGELELGMYGLSIKSGYEMTLECLNGPRDVTAIIANSDAAAYGVLQAIHEKGYSVPADYSVCGVDNLIQSSQPGIDLTTIEHHIWEKGLLAFRMLYRQICGANYSEPTGITTTEFTNELIVRGSTGPPGR